MCSKDLQFARSLPLMKQPAPRVRNRHLLRRRIRRCVDEDGKSTTRLGSFCWGAPGFTWEVVAASRKCSGDKQNIFPQRPHDSQSLSVQSDARSLLQSASWISTKFHQSWAPHVMLTIAKQSNSHNLRRLPTVRATQGSKRCSKNSHRGTDGQPPCQACRTPSLSTLILV